MKNTYCDSCVYMIRVAASFKLGMHTEQKYIVHVENELLARSSDVYLSSLVITLGGKEMCAYYKCALTMKWYCTIGKHSRHGTLSATKSHIVVM